MNPDLPTIDATEPAGDGPPRAPDPAATLQPGQDLLDGYRVERLLGRGGMGAVYLVRARHQDLRFAVKRILPERMGDAEHRRAFLRELLTWSELPEHPNLTGFRFFRSLGDQVLLFAEYVAGGSLQEWIDRGRIADPVAALDVAVQAARGLHAAHRWGVVHQDVKPGNVLMTEEGVAKITDFGLARARAASRRDSPDLARLDPTDPGVSFLTSYGGKTPAYCSPEQDEGRPLTPRTDVWSWGLTVLALFTGGATWHSGVAAPEALALLREELPEDAAAVLERCFRREPRERWSSLEEAAAALEEAIRSQTGRAYPRPLPALELPPEEPGEPARLCPQMGRRWEDPLEWVRRGLREAGEDPTGAEALVFPGQRTDRGQIIADMLGYEEAMSIYAPLLEEDRPELLLPWCQLHQQEGDIHLAAGDLSGALARYVQLEGIVLDRIARGEPGLDRGLAVVVRDQGILHWMMGRSEEAADAMGRVVEIRQRVWEAEPTVSNANQIASSHANRAALLNQGGRNQESVAELDRAVEIWEGLRGPDGEPIYLEEQGTTLMNRSVILLEDDRSEEGLACLDRSVEIFRELIYREGLPRHLDSMATIRMTQSTMLKQLDRWDEALAVQREAVELHQALVRQEPSVANRISLARNYSSLAMLQEPEEGLETQSRSMTIWEELIHREGRSEVRGTYAINRLVTVELMEKLGRGEEVRDEAREAYRIAREEAERTRKPEITRGVEWAEREIPHLLIEKRE